jgi:quercetin dioxygenase-like cupin family protein
MLAVNQAHLAVVEPHGPDAPLIPGVTATTRLSSAETGSVSIVEHLFSPGALVPPHRHTREEEVSYVVSGEIGSRSNGKEVTLAAGGYIVKPRGELHTMWNAGSTPARMIEIISPAGFEKYFLELAGAVAAARGLPDEATMGSLAGRYGLSFDLAEVPDLVARYGLTSPV